MKKNEIEHNFYQKRNAKKFIDNLEEDGETIKVDKKGSTIESLKKRAIAIYSNRKVVDELVKLHERQDNKESSYWIKRYLKSYECSKYLQTYDGVHHKATELCKYKVCVVCSRIRTAQLINAYKEQLMPLADKQFLTLTIPNVKSDELARTVREMVKNFSKARDNIRKRDEINIIGTRNMEVSFNPKYLNTTKECYHPHFHCIISGYKEANLLLDEWLRLYSKAIRVAQLIKPFGKTERDFLECFKYVNKILSESEEVPIEIAPDETGFTEMGNFVREIPARIYIQALDIINRATSGIGHTGTFRTFQAFGIKKNKEEEEREPTEEELIELDMTNFQDFQYIDDLSDWISSNGNNLTDFKPSEPLRKRMQEDIIPKYQEEDFEGFDASDYGEKKEQKEDIKEYNQLLKKFKGYCEIWSLPKVATLEVVLMAYKTLCEGEKTDELTISVVQKIKGKTTGVYHPNTKTIEILEKNRFWLVTVIHEFTHQIQDITSPDIRKVKWHTAQFRQLHSEYLKKYFKKIVEIIKPEIKLKDYGK